MDLRSWTTVYSCSSQKIIAEARQNLPLHVVFWFAAVRMDTSMKVEQRKVNRFHESHFIGASADNKVDAQGDKERRSVVFELCCTFTR